MSAKKHAARLEDFVTTDILRALAAVSKYQHLGLLADKGVYQRVGEATELALRVLAEKIGLLGYAARALDTLSKTERATYCNDHWQHDYKKVICST